MSTSLGQTIGLIAGVVVGVVVGYFTGGYGWVLMGAALGAALGSYIDPVQADAPNAGQPAYGELEMTTATEGMVLPDALGTVKLVGNIFYYGGNRNVAVTEKVKSGGKGGGGSSKKVVVGYKYYLSWATGICLGPIDSLLAVYMQDDLVWEGPLDRPAASGMSAITLDSLGTMYINWGGSNNSAVGGVTTPLNDFFWVYFNDCFVGGANRAPIIKFVFKKRPTFAFSGSGNIGLYDYNAAHAINYIMTTQCGLPAAWIDSTSFAAAATGIAKITELRGISFVFNSQQTALEYIANILSHIDGLIRFGISGMFEMKLLRSTVDKDDLPEITNDDLVKPAVIRRSHWIEVTNDIKVQYAERVQVDSGYPDIYAFSFIDESVGNGTPATYEGQTNGYTIAPTNMNPNLQWDTDIAQWKAGVFSWLRSDNYLRGCCIKTERESTGYSMTVIPTGYTFNSDLIPYGCFYSTMDLVGYGFESTLKTPFLDNMIPTRGYIPGSWFVFNIDDTSTSEQVQENSYEVINAFVAWLTANGYDFNYFNSSGDKLQTSERWLSWLMTNVDPEVSGYSI